MIEAEHSPDELIDIGLNLTHESFDIDRAALIDRAVAAGVSRMLITGSCIENSEQASRLAQELPQRLRSTAGIHPHHAVDVNALTADQLRQLIARPEVLAVGECGLDFFRNFSPPDSQVSAFRMQLELARELRKPVFLHQRDAHRQFVQIVSEYRSGLTGGVAHCFTAGADEAREYLDLGLHIGITGWICDERRGAHLKELVKFIPLDRLLVETDAPYLLPRDLRPKPKSRRNEPMYLPHVLRTIADCRGEPPTLIARATTANAMRLFGWS
jgi:TatD DNase family protein